MQLKHSLMSCCDDKNCCRLDLVPVLQTNDGGQTFAMPLYSSQSSSQVWLRCSSSSQMARHTLLHSSPNGGSWPTRCFLITSEPATVTSMILVRSPLSTMMQPLALAQISYSPLPATWVWTAFLPRSLLNRHFGPAFRRSLEPGLMSNPNPNPNPNGSSLTKLMF